MAVLAGDVGGTKTLLMVRDGQRIIAQERYSSSGYGNLSHILREFVAKIERESGPVAIDRAVIGVAGPVHDNCCRATNLPWEIDGERISADLRIGKLKLINDFVAIGFGIHSLGAEDVVALNPHEPDPRGPIAILGAGTGLGEGFLVPSGEGRFEFLASEGGHADFAPRNEQEFGFLRFMTRVLKRVSIERAVSGPGIANLYNYLVDWGLGPTESVAKRVAAGEDIGAVVTDHARARTCQLCVEVMDLFLSLYGAEAGNMALRILASGGVYVAGGIAPKILDLIRTGPFMAAFGDKGRLSDLVRSFPVRVISNPTVGLLGSARVAEEL